jgi:hypothetical protein
MLQPPHIGHCLGSLLLSSTHLCPHFRHIHFGTFFHSNQSSVSVFEHLIFSITREQFMELEHLSSFPQYVCRFDFNFLRYERNLFAAVRAFAIVGLDYLVWRFQFCAFIEDKTAFFTNYLLRQDLTAVAERNTTDTNYLCIMTRALL